MIALHDAKEDTGAEVEFRRLDVDKTYFLARLISLKNKLWSTTAERAVLIKINKN